jgi:hypothetical protein
MSFNENCLGIKFSELERIIYDMALGLGRHVLAETLEAMSQGLHMLLDSSRYENKGISETHINTLLGTVAYRRHVYMTGIRAVKMESASASIPWMSGWG